MNKIQLTQFIRYISYVLIIAVLVMSIQAGARQRRTSDQTNQIVKQLQQNNVVRDNNVQKLLSSNDQQTLILCDIIISTNVTLSSDDIAKVEAVCKDKIKQAQTGQAALTTPTTTTIPNQAPNNTNQPSNPDLSNQPSAPPAPKQNIIQKTGGAIMNIVDKVKSLL